MSGTAPNPPAPFSPAPASCPPFTPQSLMNGGPVALMHRDLVTTLQAAFPPAQFVHQTLPPRLTQESWNRFTTRTPFVGIGWVKMAPVSDKSMRPRIWSGYAHWTVFLVCKNPRVDAQLLGDSGGPGLAGMLAVATAALHGRSIGGIGNAEVGEGGQVYSEAFATEAQAQAALNVTVPFSLVDLLGLSQLDDFLRLGQSWAGLPNLVADIRDDGVVAE